MTGLRTLLLTGLLVVCTAAAWAAGAPPGDEQGGEAAASVPEGTPPPSAALSSRSPALYPPSAPTRVRIMVLGGSGSVERANRVAVLLSEYRRRELEERIGLKIEVANVSIVTGTADPNAVYYRPPFLRAALILAEAVPGEQAVQPMTEDALKKAGIDVEIWVGADGPASSTRQGKP